MNSHPKVVIDIATLGAIQVHRQNARGVHRVAEKLVSGLAASQKCELAFVATSEVFASYRLAKETPAFSQFPFLLGRQQLILAKWANQKKRWITETLADRRLSSRIWRTALYHLSNQADIIAGHFSATKLTDADIYHSPQAPIPDQIQRSQAKRFLTVHDLIPITQPTSVNGLGVSLLRRQLRSLTPDSYAFCVSEHVRNDLLKHSQLPPDNVFVTPLAAAPENFYPVTQPELIRNTLKKYGLPDAPYFLTLSSFDPRKNFPFLIECFGRLASARELPEHNLVIVGTNPERHSFYEAALARHPQLKKRILAPGFIPDEDLAPIYSNATAFVFPSLSEGFGIPPLEAMQCGIPVIASNTTSIPEVVGEAGILLPPTEMDAWCQAMLRISQDSSLRNQLREKSLLRCRRFTWDRFIQETLRGYANALKLA